MRLSHVENYLEHQLTLMGLIADTSDKLIRVGRSNITQPMVQARLTDLKENWEQFSVRHKAIGLAIRSLSSEDGTRLLDHVYFTDNFYSLTHECYLEEVDKLNSLIVSEHAPIAPVSPSASGSNNPTASISQNPAFYHHARLPRIDLPKFGGSQSDWLSFKDLFNSLVIMNPTLTSVERLQYLKTSVTGSAALLLKNTTLTSDNFQKAWDALISYYENTRLLVNEALQSFYSLKRMTKESASEMEQLYTSIMQIYRTLETLQRPVQTWDDVLVFNIVQRLDSDSVKAWEQHLGSAKQPPTWDQFSTFLLNRLRSLQAFEKCQPGKSTLRSQQAAAKSHFQGKSKEDKAIKPNSCAICSAKHYIAHCPQYTSKTVQQRIAIIAKHKLCFNCLGLHRASACRVTKRCLKCGGKHHTTIHRLDKKPVKSELTPSNSNPKNDSTSTESTSTDAKAVHSATTLRSTPCVLLATAQIRIEDPHGQFFKARALIDQGSEISLISERFVQRLHLPRKQSFTHLIGIGAQKVRRTRGVVTCKFKPHFDSEYECTISAHILSKLTTSLPSVRSEVSAWAHLRGLLYADPEFAIPGAIDIILGADVYGHIIEEGLVKGAPNNPVAQCTKIGWIISGPTGNDSPPFSNQSCHVSMDRELYDLIHRFWELEEVPSSVNSSLSAEDQQCELHFQSTHTRDTSGRYQVRLPFRQSVDQLGDSRAKAMQIIASLSKKLTSDTPYAKAYDEFMEEYENLQHMSIVSDSAPEPQHVCYLPHHGVLRENDLNRIRVVFNGSSLTSTGYSLNELLHTGAKLQINLYDVLVWFRHFPYAFSSDMIKMYRQIVIHPDDRDFQRILWFCKTKGVRLLRSFQLNTVTYGLVCAPYLALRTLAQLVKDEGKNYPLAVPILKKGCYVDDILGGADSVHAAQETVQQVTGLCMAGGFSLHKWASNNTEVLKSIPPDKRTMSSLIKLDESTTVHTLGLCWNPHTDTFHFTITLPEIKVLTKRAIMSVVARIFDPLGLLSPVIVTPKILIQELWTLKLGWDDPLPTTVSHKWNNFVIQLQGKPDIAIPRWIGVTSNHSIEVHGFCDASQHAIAAAVYVRSTSVNGETQVSLLCAKTKVAPLKRFTIPRLELEGAVLATRLISQVLSILQWETAPVVIWLDSAVAFTWITNHPSRWKDYVHNRVDFIQKTLPHATWRFVRGKENPADCATRGLTPAQLSTFVTWWHGPPWLSQPSSLWPNDLRTPTLDDNLEERPARVGIIAKDVSSKLWDLAFRYSSFRRLIRITATIIRAIARLRRSKDLLSATPFTPQELEKATSFWIKSVQHLYFQQDLQTIAKGQPLSKTSPLFRLTPFVDSDGFLRIKGRLDAAFLPTNAKHPLILPRRSPITELIIGDAHLRTMHGGTQLTTAFVRQNYWIVGGRAPIRTVILKCVRCARYRQKRVQQLMGPLPVENLTPSRAFLNTGVDYAGPFTLKTWRGRNAKTYKAYIALFVCHATSAIHLELVTDYSTDAFLAAYKRFTARRGICATLMSDCGTNFKGADSELKKLFSSSSKELGEMATLLANHGTQWRFNPPAAPHFGGKWEAGVRSVKFHLKRVVGDALLTFEEMNTLLTQIEATLNSRPLCPLTDDPEDLNALTPGHFLMGGVPVIIPEPSLETVKVSRLSRWQMIRHMLDCFWARWSSECLQRYLSIYKWNKVSPPLSVGSLVLVIDERYPPSKWPLGRITDTHPGPDGHIRVVTVRTQTSVLKRPIVKVCPLPIRADTV